MQTPTELDSLPKRLKFARERRKMSQRGLAKAANLAAHGHVGLIEGGRPVDSVDIVSRLAEALGVSMDWLVNGGELPSDLEPVEVAPTPAFPVSVPPAASGAS